MAVIHLTLFLIVAALACAQPLARAAQPELANGVFLVAKPELMDPNFRETVVLITQPEVGGGPLGVIINWPLNTRLSEIYPSVTGMPAQFDVVYQGGPVQPVRILYLLRAAQRPEFTLPVLQDVYLGGDRELLDKIAGGQVKVSAFRAYAGYAGWAPRQLQAEIAAGGWWLAEADAGTIFTADPATLWGEMVKRLNMRSTRASAISAGDGRE
jgi:putative transcriptional regulator